MKESGLNSLLVIHARLLLSRETLSAYMREASRRDLQTKLNEATARRAAATSEPIQRSLDGNIEILKKRLAYHENANQNLVVIDSELERIENQVALIREELAMSRDPAALSARIDSVASTIGEANQFLINNEALFGALAPNSDLDAPPRAPLPRQNEKA